MIGAVSHIAYRISSFGAFVHDIRNTIYDIRVATDETDLITFTGQYSLIINSGVFIGIS
jgi:proteasome assembly chaperone (PAC2) family protein